MTLTGDDVEGLAYLAADETGTDSLRQWAAERLAVAVRPHMDQGAAVVSVALANPWPSIMAHIAAGGRRIPQA